MAFMIWSETSRANRVAGERLDAIKSQLRAEEQVRNDKDARERENRKRELENLTAEAEFLDFQRVFSGVERPKMKLETRQIALRALEVAGVDLQSQALPVLAGFNEAEQELIQSNCFQLLLILGDTFASDGAGQKSAEGTDIYERRAASLSRQGFPLAAARVREEAAHQSHTTHLAYFLLGYDEWFKEGRDLNKALHYFNNALQRKRDFFWGWVFRAACYEKLRNLIEAKASLTVAISQRDLAQPGLVWCYLYRGYLNTELGMFAEAEADLSQAQALDQDGYARYVGHNNCGYLRLRQADTLERMANLTFALNAISNWQPSPVGMFVNLAGALRVQWLTGAVHNLQLAADEGDDLEPKQYPAHLNLAQAYGRLGKFKEAGEEMDKAIVIKPQSADLYTSRALLCVQRGDRDGALRDLKEAIHLSRQGNLPEGSLAQVHFRRGLLFYQMGKYVEAAHDCDEALRLRHGDYNLAHLLRAETLLRLNRLTESLGDFDEFLRTEKPAAGVLADRALASVRLGDVEAAIGDYTLALSITPVARLYTNRGWVYLINEAPRPALRDFDNALRLDPRSWEAYSGRALARAKCGTIHSALADAEQALLRGPRKPALLLSTARTYALLVGRMDLEPGRHSTRYLETRCEYQDRAVKLLNDALELLLTRKEQTAFWENQIRGHPDLSAIRNSSGFARLVKRFPRSSNRANR
jgi:tetratricopeptide (TPR) repeat protein